MVGKNNLHDSRVLPIRGYYPHSRTSAAKTVYYPTKMGQALLGERSFARSTYLLAITYYLRAAILVIFHRKAKNVKN